jgi:hypothetical protein
MKRGYGIVSKKIQYRTLLFFTLMSKVEKKLVLYHTVYIYYIFFSLYMRVKNKHFKQYLKSQSVTKH